MNKKKFEGRKFQSYAIKEFYILYREFFIERDMFQNKFYKKY